MADARLTCRVTFGVAESLETLDNILRDWAKDKVLSRYCGPGTRIRTNEEKAASFLENDSASVGSRAKLKQTQNCFALWNFSNLTNPTNKML